MALNIGIFIEPRRRSKSVEQLKEHKSKVILFPIYFKKPRKGDPTDEECMKATQLHGGIMPHKKVTKRQLAMEITDVMQKLKARTLQSAIDELEESAVTGVSAPRQRKTPRQRSMSTKSAANGPTGSQGARQG